MKKTLAVLTAVLVLAGLTACGSGKAAVEEKETAVEETTAAVKETSAVTPEGEYADIKIVYYGWGVAGVAIATVIAQIVNMLLLSYRMTVKNSPCKFEFKDLKIDWGFLKKMLRIGIPAGLQSSMYGISNLLLQVGVNSLGTVVVASWALSGKTDGLFWAITSAAGAAITTFTGQNYGAGRIDRIKQSVKISMILFTIITVCTSVILLVFGIPMLHILTTDQAVVEMTYQIMCYLVPMYFLWTVIEVYSGILRGLGDSVYPVIITGIGICLFRIVWLITVFRIFPTLPSLCICYPASWLVTDIALVWYYYRKSMISKEYRQLERKIHDE